MSLLDGAEAGVLPGPQIEGDIRINDGTLGVPELGTKGTASEIQDDVLDVVPHLQRVLESEFPDVVVTGWDSRNLEIEHRGRKIGGALIVLVDTVEADGTRSREIEIDGEHRHGLPEDVITELGKPAVYWATLPLPAGGIYIDGQPSRSTLWRAVASPDSKPNRYIR
jgi:hypothetical protein